MILYLCRVASKTSRRRSPLRFLASGPWQAKQASVRMGRTSRPKSTFLAEPDGPSAREAAARASRQSEAIKGRGLIIGGRLLGGGSAVSGGRREKFRIPQRGRQDKGLPREKLGAAGRV